MAESGCVRKNATMNTTETSLAGDAEQAAPITLRLGPAHLIVTDLDRSIEFYERSIGLRVRARDAGSAILWAGGAGDLLVLAGRARRPPGGPSRRASTTSPCCIPRASSSRARPLASPTPARRSWARPTTSISEAIYLHDPDGNEIELAADRPSDAWPDLANPGWDGGPKPLDLHGLLDLVAAEPVQQRADPGLTVGHLHLHVGDVERGLAFYRDVLGFEVMTRHADRRVPGRWTAITTTSPSTSGAASAFPPRRPATVGLRHWTIVYETPQALAEVLARIEAGRHPDRAPRRRHAGQRPMGHRAAPDRPRSNLRRRTS